jgi:hypothetical protein
MLMPNVEQRLFLLFWIGSYFMVKYMSIVIINKQKDNPMNNSMCHFAIAISIGDGGGNQGRSSFRAGACRGPSQHFRF